MNKTSENIGIIWIYYETHSSDREIKIENQKLINKLLQV